MICVAKPAKGVGYRIKFVEQAKVMGHDADAAAGIYAYLSSDRLFKEM